MAKSKFTLKDVGIYLHGEPQVYNRLSDSAATIQTASALGIHPLLTSYIDQNVIDAVLAPARSAQIFGEFQKGDWTTDNAVFMIAEPTGETASYGDFNNSGSSSVNIYPEMRQTYRYQTWARFGDLEAEMFGNAAIDFASRVLKASALTLNRFQNKTYISGVKNLKNYGFTNDPSLSPATASSGWGTKDAVAVVTEINKLFAKLAAQTKGKVGNESTYRDANLMLLMSPEFEAEHMLKVNQFGVTVFDTLKKAYPNLEIWTLPEFATGGGHLVQMIAKDIDGQPNIMPAYGEKLRTHRPEQHSSYILQKLSQTSYGSIVVFPFAVAQILCSN